MARSYRCRWDCVARLGISRRHVALCYRCCRRLHYDTGTPLISVPQHSFSSHFVQDGYWKTPRGLWWRDMWPAQLLDQRTDQRQVFAAAGENVECCICLDEAKAPQKCPQCSFRACSSCANQALRMRPSCPQCRLPLATLRIAAVNMRPS